MTDLYIPATLASDTLSRLAIIVLNVMTLTCVWPVISETATNTLWTSLALETWLEASLAKMGLLLVSLLKLLLDSIQTTFCFDYLGSGSGVAGAGGDLDGSGDASGGGSSATSPGESRRLSIQRCIQSLVHACQCRDANCRLPSCHKMKRVVQHAKSCKRKSNQQGGAQTTQAPGCPICKQLIALCCYHAKHCTEAKCPVPYCINIKHKLKQQQLQQRLQQAQILKRRIASMASMNQQSQPQPPQQQQQHDFSPSQPQPPQQVRF